jgi:hypothetical protein
VGRALASEIRVCFDSLAQAIERVRWLDVHADQVLGRQVKVVFPDLDPGAIQLGGEQHDEGVAGVLLDLGPLVLVADVLERQLVKLERVLEQREVGGIRVLDVEPETLLTLEQAC